MESYDGGRGVVRRVTRKRRRRKISSRGCSVDNRSIETPLQPVFRLLSLYVFPIQDKVDEVEKINWQYE